MKLKNDQMIDQRFQIGDKNNLLFLNYLLIYGSHSVITLYTFVWTELINTDIQNSELWISWTVNHHHWDTKTSYSVNSWTQVRIYTHITILFISFYFVYLFSFISSNKFYECGFERFDTTINTTCFLHPYSHHIKNR